MPVSSERVGRCSRQQLRVGRGKRTGGPIVVVLQAAEGKGRRGHKTQTAQLRSAPLHLADVVEHGGIQSLQGPTQQVRVEAAREPELVCDGAAEELGAE